VGINRDERTLLPDGRLLASPITIHNRIPDIGEIPEAFVGGGR
jgi:hypothetical protein